SYLNRIQLDCRNGEEILRAVTQMVQSRVDLLRIFEPPKMNDEDVHKILRSLVIANPDAPKLTADWSVDYPAKDGSRTDVRMTLLVPRGEVTPNQVGAAEVYSVDVTGEMLKDGQLWEKYRYRFDFPGDFKGDKLPIVIDRLLRPADYIARIKVIDANTGAEAVIERPLTVPEIFTPVAEETEPEEATLDVGAPLRDKTVAELKAEAKADEARVRIVPLVEEVVNGIQTIETIATGSAIKAVEFWLDGKKVAVRRSPPFALDLDFGNVPHMRRIRAVALDGNDQPITGDDITVNTGTDPFRVRITSPRIAPRISGPTRVDIDVSVPDGETLDGVELYWNQTRIATLFDPPFVQTVDIPETEGVGYLRAVARLKDSDTPPIEDLVLLNTPAYMEELNVHLVELPTTVTMNGKPTSHLTEKAFQVFDEGKPVPIAKFEYVKNLPLSIGLAIDTSGSMQPRMDEAQKAGAQFFQNVMRKGDKAFLVAFDSEPQLVQRWSTKVADVHAGLAKLRAEESTALYDAVVYSLYNFLGIRGQKALVLITDGKDTASKFTYDHALEYARRAAVPIYAIGIGIKGNDHDVRY
ncbi:MAG TPA: VWA domain-containing protein, partial [Thermoanaerobaculia bacterium]|nr:VWA domain-containing protein [Thermoanaerobaculia bacterium]